MEIANTENDTKLIFSKLNGKLKITMETEESQEYGRFFEDFGENDFEEFLSNIKILESTVGYVTIDEEKD